MRLSSKKLSSSAKTEILTCLHRLMADLSSEKEASNFCQQLLSPAEQIALAKRVAILWALKKGQKYSQIRARFHISPATIAKFQAELSQPGVQEILRHLEAEEWATRWEKKIKNILNISS